MTLFLAIMAAIGTAVCMFALVFGTVFVSVWLKDWYRDTSFGWARFVRKAERNEEKWNKDNGILP